MFGIDLVGRVDNTSLSSRQGLLPVFEAIFNSIQAISEANIDNGEIEIFVIRDKEILLINDEEQMKIAPITGFEISDNGIGFNSDNYQSFNTSDSQKKKKIGGKGVGRLLWLKAFDEIKVDSIFRENGDYMHRSFDFVLNNYPIIDHKCDSAELTTSPKTTIYLHNIKQSFIEHIPKRLDVIAYRIVEHCLEFFILGIMPNIKLFDEEETIDLYAMYQEMVSQNDQSTFEINDQQFTLIHFLLKAHAGMSHKVSFCAIHRVVESKKIDSKLIPNLPTRISSTTEEDEDFVYMVYVSSPFLDSHVNQQRSGFNTYLEEQIQFIGELPWQKIEEETFKKIREHLLPITEPLKEDKWKSVQTYVHDSAPEYRSLLKYKPDLIDNMSPDLTSSKMDLELYKIQKDWEVELREKAEKIINVEADTFGVDENEINEKYSEFLEEWNENGKSALAKYVVHRKTTLEILEKCLQKNEQDKYSKEKLIHKLIFPLNKTSDDIGYEQQNLWILDEKLAFHHYLASDKEIRSIDEIDSEDRERPDLIIFDKPIAIVDNEPINGITIIEFKRPMRFDSNPVTQMLRYVRSIRSGKQKTNHGRGIKVTENTPFYCYAICDIQEQIQNQLEEMGMMVTPDNQGFFDYNQNLHAYIEVISYDKLLLDAKKRNKALFTKLNISD